MVRIEEEGSEGKAELVGMSLDELARTGAQRMLAAALEAEVSAYLTAHREQREEDGTALVVRNGHARARKVPVGSGTIEVRAPRVDDQRVDAAGERQRFRSRILPPYMRRSPKVAEVLPILYLRGLSTGDFRAALPVLLGEDAAGLGGRGVGVLEGGGRGVARDPRPAGLVPPARQRARQAAAALAAQGQARAA